MNPLLYLEGLEYPEKCAKEIMEGVNEVIATPQSLSRFGKMSLGECEIYAEKFLDDDIKTSLDWDIIMTQEKFIHASHILKNRDLSIFSCLRVKDVGAYEWSLKHLSLPIGMNLENGNHNLNGLLKWIERGGDRLERIILSLEIPRTKLSEYIAEIKKTTNVKIEILGLGPILLFTTPRKILSHAFNLTEMLKEENHEYLLGEATSEESPHRGFRLIENTHGTYMFHPKDISLTEVAHELKDMGVDYFRIDSRFHSHVDIATIIKAIKESDKDLIVKNWPTVTMRGYSDSNRTDRLFSKLKNQKIARSDDFFVGEVLDVIKGELIGVRIKRKDYVLKCGDCLNIKTPEGREKNLLVTFIKSPEMMERSHARTGDLVYLPYVSGVSVRSMLMLS